MASREGTGWALARAGTPVGVAAVGSEERSRLVSFDSDGVIWVLAFGTRRELVSMSLARAWRFYPSTGKLVRAMRAGRCVGIVHALWRDGPLFPFEGSL